MYAKMRSKNNALAAVEPRLIANDSDIEAQKDVTVSQMLALLEQLRSLPKDEVLGRLQAFGWLRQLLVENGAYLKRAFREHGGFQTVITSIAADGGQPEFGMEGTSRARSGIAVLSQALAEHHENQRYFEDTIGGSGALLDALAASGALKISKGEGDSFDVLFGILFAFALHDDSISGLFVSARKSVQAMPESSRSPDLNKDQEEILQTRVAQSGLESCAILTPSVFIELSDLAEKINDKVLSFTFYRALVALVERNINNSMQLASTRILRQLFRFLFKSDSWTNGSTRILLRLIRLLSALGLEDDDLKTLLVTVHSQRRPSEQQQTLLDLLLHVASSSSRMSSFRFSFGTEGPGFVHCQDPLQEPSHLSTSYTFCTWLLVENLDDGYKVPLWALASRDALEPDCQVYLGEQNRSVEIKIAGEDSVIFDQSMIEENKLVHLAIVHTKNRLTASQASLYLNGELLQQLPCKYPIFDRRKAIDCFVGGHPDQASLGQGSSSPIWNMGPTLLMDGALSGDLIYVMQTLGPGYTGNYQDSLGSMQTYTTSTALNFKLEEKIQSSPERQSAVTKSALVLAIRGKAGDLVPEHKMILHLIPTNTIESRSTSPLGMLNVSGEKTSFLGEKARHGSFVFNSAIPQFSKTLSCKHGIAQYYGDCTFVKTSSLSSGIWKLGGPAILLSLVEQSESSQRLDQTLRLFVDVLVADWRISEDVEKTRGYEILARLLKLKRSFLTPAIQASVFTLCGFDVLTPNKALVTNPLAFRVLLLDFDIWHLCGNPFEDKLAVSHLNCFKVFLESSDNTSFNAKRLGKLQVAKKMLSALRMKKIPTHLLDLFCSVLSTVLRRNFAADAVRTTATLIASSICPTFKAVHEAEDKTPPITMASATVSRSEGEAVMRVLASLLLDRVKQDFLDKFAEVVTNRWTLLFLQYPTSPEASRMAMAILVRLLVTQGERYVNKFRSGCDGFVVLETSIPTLLDYPDLLQYLFILLAGRDSAKLSIKNGQLDDHFLRALLVKRSRLQVLCTDVVPVIYLAVQTSFNTHPKVHEDLVNFIRLVLAHSPEFGLVTSDHKTLEQVFCLSVVSQDSGEPSKTLMDQAYLIHESTRTSTEPFGVFALDYTTPVDWILYNEATGLSRGSDHGSHDYGQADLSVELARLLGLALAISLVTKKKAHRSIAQSLVLLGRPTLSKDHIIFVRIALQEYIIALHEAIRNELDLLADDQFRQAIVSEANQLTDLVKAGWTLSTSVIQLVDLIVTVLNTTFQLTNLGQISPNARPLRTQCDILRRLFPIGISDGPEVPCVIRHLTQEHLSIFQIETPDLEKLTRDIELLATLDVTLSQEIGVMLALRRAITQNDSSRGEGEGEADLHSRQESARNLLRESQIEAAKLFRDQMALIVAGGRKIKEIKESRQTRLFKFVSRTERWIQTIQQVELARLVKAKQDSTDHLDYIRIEFEKLQKKLSSRHAVFDKRGPTSKESWRLDFTEGPARMRKKLRKNDDQESLDSILSSVGMMDTGVQHLTGNIPATQGEMEAERLEPVVGVDENDIVLEDTAADEAEEDRLRKILRRLESGDKIVHAYNMSRIVGIEMEPGIILLGKLNIYLIDGYFIKASGEIVNTGDAPESERDIYVLSILAQAPSSTKTNTGIHKTRKWRNEALQELRTRRYLFRDVALELFFHDGQSFLLTFTAQDRDDIYAKLIAQSAVAVGDEYASAAPRLVMRSHERDASFGSNLSHRFANAFSLSSDSLATRQWQRGELSNFAYLMHLNQLAGRTYNDLTQYPVFPWIISDYQSEQLDLTSPETFRDLKKPMGAQGERRAAEFAERYEESREMTQGGKPFYYGTHYSSAMIVCSYLIRLEPFTRQYIKLQGGLDHADRLFSSIAKAWSSASADNRGDVRELIPEFFHNPAFLINGNGYNLGKKQDGDEEVNDVELPKWAKGDPLLFVELQRRALESDYVSANLHHWIDLIFGYKQQGDAAEQCMNVFHPLSYSGAINLDSVQDATERNAMVGIIHNFGQTPRKLFHKSHPIRISPSNNTLSYTIPENVSMLTQVIKPIRSLGSCISSIEADPSDVGNPKAWKTQTVGLQNHRGCYLQWGSLDGSMRLFDSSGRLLTVYESMHCGLVTHAAIADDSTLLTAGTDAIVTIWRMSWQKDKLCLEASERLRGHTGEILCMTASRSYSLALTGSADHSCIIWDLNSMCLVKRLKLGGPVQQVAVNQVTGDLATCAGTKMSIWTVNGDPLASVETSQMSDPIVSLCFFEGSEKDWLPHCILFTGHEKGEIQVWQLCGPEVARSERKMSLLTRLRHSDRSSPIEAENDLKTLPRITALAQCGRTLYHGDNLGRLYLWNLPDGTYRFPENTTSTCMLCRRSFAIIADPRRHCQACAAIHCSQCSIAVSGARYCKVCHTRLFEG